MKQTGSFTAAEAADSAGTLYICSTPIGNMRDITLRVLEVLQAVDLIAAEDTRTTVKILNHFDIQTPLTSYHQHNEAGKSQKILKSLADGQDVALVSDAGTPGISDPGSVVIMSAIEAGFPIAAVPGPTACMAALVVSGIATDRFCFEGFLPRKKKEKRHRLEELSEDPRTLIFYEAPHRVQETLEDMTTAFVGRRCALVRELTKKFEQVQRGLLQEVLDRVCEEAPRGEYVIVVEGLQRDAGKKKAYDEGMLLSAYEHVYMLIQQGNTKTEAVKKAAGLRGLPRKVLYHHVLSIPSIPMESDE